jgi:hypothetical protein
MRPNSLTASNLPEFGICADDFLEKKVQTKNEVLAELMAEHVALIKTLGEL